VENQEKFIKMAEAYGFEAYGVPTIFIGDRYWEGYAETLQPEIEGVINACIENGCKDAGAGVIFPAETQPPNPTAIPNPDNPGNPGESENRVIKVPLFGEIDLNNQPLFIATALIAFVDGVNPCSIWVLTMLIALTLHTGSRKRVALIGIIFISITALVYALFIAGLFTFLTFISFVTWIQVVVALVALVFALVNIKDYFWYKEGVSFTISDEKKPGLFKRMRKVLEASNSLWGVISATVVLAAGVSLVEFSCTAGFPVLWTNMVSSQGVETGEFVLLLLLYMVIYQIDELVIFFAAVFTLKASRMEEKHGRILKLIGGTLMLTLAGVMIFNPNLLNDLNSALVIFAVAFGLTALILLVHRKILPSFGIWIGTEKDLKKKSTKKKVSSEKLKKMSQRHKK
jgi:cytochrome c biogenesis protein CcdA